MNRRVLRVFVGLCLFAWLGAAAALAQTYSHARIVRLSFTEGTVTVQRPDVPEWAAAPVNTPIQEGFRLATGAGSFAEIEFENTSTARIGQLSQIEFVELSLAPSGGKINRLALTEGYATFHVDPEGEDVFEVKTPNATLTPSGKSMFRVDLEEGVMRVEAFKGAVQVASAFGTELVAKGSVMVVRPGADQPMEISRGITKDDWDEWVDKRESAQARLDRRRVPGVYTNDVSSMLYGWDDLWNYGNWASVPGYGYGWYPNMPFGWSPYTLGRWCWYPTFGYTWISAEPWGWLPYHFGQWAFVTGVGWAWIPGGFNTWVPSQVVWFQGPGWVGWAPRVPGPVVHGGFNCPSSRGCVSAVSLDAFQNGKPVTPSSMLAVNPAQGQLVNKPDVSPGRSTLLPGPPHHAVGGISRITFDPRSRTFVNAATPATVTIVTTPTATSPVQNAGVTSQPHPGAPVGAKIFNNVPKGPNMLASPEHGVAPSSPATGPTIHMRVVHEAGPSSGFQPGGQRTPSGGNLTTHFGSVGSAHSALSSGGQGGSSGGGHAGVSGGGGGVGGGGGGAGAGAGGSHSGGPSGGGTRH